MFRGFQDDFGGTFLIGLMTSLFTFLWSLLFVIPGIVKMYAYSMAYYIKLDHPDYGWKACIDESRQLMDGHKWEKFVLDLMFLIQDVHQLAHHGRGCAFIRKAVIAFGDELLT